MASPRVSVVVSTHSHARLLPLAVASGLAQEGVDLELLIAGDGMTEETRRSAEDLAATDDRVRVLDLPKAPRVGEENRDRAVEAASGDVVLYLADDDLWLPDHARAMCELLDGGVELAVAPQLVVLRSGGTRIVPHDYGAGQHRDLLREGFGRVALAALGHRRADYGAAVPRWRTTDGSPSDLEFAAAYLAAGGERMASTADPTVILFPSPQREDMPLEERERELRSWWERVSDPESLRELRGEIPALWRDAAVAADARWQRLEMRSVRLARHVEELQARLARARERHLDQSRRLAERNERIAELTREARPRERAEGDPA